MTALEPGDPASIGRYRIEARIGAGDTATVYLGRTAAGRSVAVAVPHAHRAADPYLRQRLRREASVGHAVGGYGVAVLDADPGAKRPWLATEYVPSVSLREAVDGWGALPADALWPLAAGLVEALRSMHDAGLVHLDVQPATVLLAADGLRLTGFGISRELADGGAPAGPPAGTPGFMSPEQAAGGLVGPASDVFSLGATLGYAVVGPAAFGAPGWPDRIADDDLRRMIERCLRRAPSGRPAVPVLTEYLDSLHRRRGQAGTGGWPEAVLAEINRRRAWAENPPPARPARSTRRDAVRYALVGAGVAVLAAGGAVWAATGSSRGTGAVGPAAVPAPTRGKASPTPSPTRPARTLEFVFTGDVTLTSLSYTVNRRTAEGHGLHLPLRLRFSVPPGPGSTAWRLRFDMTPGEVTYRVLVDGIPVESSLYGNSAPDTVHDHGTV